MTRSTENTGVAHIPNTHGPHPSIEQLRSGDQSTTKASFNSRKEDGGNLVLSWGAVRTAGSYSKISGCWDFHKYVNQYGTMKHIGNPTNLRILDLPCGSGIYARSLLENGATFVTSVDIDRNMVNLCREAVEDSGHHTRWRGLVADASHSNKYPGGPFDLARVNFLLENFADLDTMTAALRNIFDNLKPGGRFVGMYAPGAHLPEQRKIVADIVGMETEDLTTVQSGDIVHVNYCSDGVPHLYSWYFRTQEDITSALEAAGFVDVRLEKPVVDRSYNGSQDLHLFVKHVGNRHILGRKPE